MRNRNETSLKTISPNVVPTPIGLFDFLKIVKVVFYKQVCIDGGNRYGPNRQLRWRRRVEKTMMVWNPNKAHKFWSRFVNGSDV